jgi:A/G-specific adenine glycosylase
MKVAGRAARKKQSTAVAVDTLVEPLAPVTSPLVGEVGAKRRVGVKPHAQDSRLSPLPSPLPQGGREQTACAARPSASNESSSKPNPADLLAWYDRHRRVLPWRAQPGEQPDPYRVWLSEIMLQQTTVRAVAPYYARFLARFPDVAVLAAAPLDDVLKAWAGLGYYARARNLHACARAVVGHHAGRFPDTEEALRALPGIGAYTAAAIAAIAFGRRASPVDGNVERVVARLYATAEPLPAAKPILRRLAAELTPAERPGDFAQALMDLGATICTPRQPSCILCPWNDPCTARRRGDAETFPRKTAKAEGRLRRGAAFVAMRQDGAVLVRTRPPSGLLGGMSEVPTTPWTHEFESTSALAAAPFATESWRRLPGVVTHTFTHFPLELTVYVARVPLATPAVPDTRWVAADELAGEAFPNVMRKVLAYARLE